MMVRAGADAVIAEGTEAGGHIGNLTTMTLIPQIVDAVDVPVIAAGGIADSRGAAAAFALGADAIQVGTRFLVASECTVHVNYKKRVIKAKDIDTDVTGRQSGHPVRGLRNKLTRQYIKMEKQQVSQTELDALGAGALRKAVVDGDIHYGSVMAGQVAGLVKTEETCQEIIDDIFNGIDEVLSLKQIIR
jgi:enoyl-[acyl-carrier protein] reductase II